MKFPFSMKGLAGIAVAGVLALGASGAAHAEGMTKEQGDAMLSELRQIRQILSGVAAPRQAAPAAPGPADKVKVRVGRDFSLGNNDAPLVLVEFTDYQCPFCSRFYTGIFPEIKKQYIDTGKMRFVSRDFPLEFHPQAMKAAQAARCAGEQKKFWEMKDALMTNSAQLSPDLITSLASARSLNMDEFKGCMESDREVVEIRDSIDAARSIGISGTPSFVMGRLSGETVEGYLIVGAQPFANFDAMAKKLLSESK